MSTEIAIRPASRSDAEAIRTVAERSMRASYDLSPQEISAIAEAAFDEAFQQTIAADDRLQYVAERNDTVLGFVQGDVAPSPTLVWLHVDPDYRGQGVGTRLFGQGVAALRDRAGEPVRATVAASAREGREFFASFGFEKTDERDRTVDGLTVTEHVYAPADADQAPWEPTDEGDAADDPAVSQPADASLARADVPETVTDGGEEVYLGEEALSGVDGPFAQTYADADRRDAYGYYCVNCRSTAVAVDSMERLECGDCGNVHRPDDDYDGAYL